MTETNGKPVHSAWLRIDMDMTTHQCAMVGEAPGIDTWLAMLAQVTRELEAQQRVARAIEMQRAAQEQAETERLAKLITKRG